MDDIERSFGWNLPEAITLPHALPDIDSAEYWPAAENVVAAYKAGRAAADRGAVDALREVGGKLSDADRSTRHGNSGTANTLVAEALALVRDHLGGR